MQEYSPEHFREHERIIYFLAHKWCKKRKGVDLDDMIEVGYEYYVWCLNNFDPTKKMKFSSYFFMQLNQRMLDEIRRSKHHVDLLYEDMVPSWREREMSFENLLAAPAELSDEYRAELLKDAKREISYEAFIILDWILSFKWLVPGRHNTPTQLFCQRCTGLSQVAVKTGYLEIKRWWGENGWKVSEAA